MIIKLELFSVGSSHIYEKCNPSLTEISAEEREAVAH